MMEKVSGKKLGLPGRITLAVSGAFLMLASTTDSFSFDKVGFYVLPFLLCAVLLALIIGWFDVSFKTDSLPESDIVLVSVILYAVTYLFRKDCISETLNLFVFFGVLLTLASRVRPSRKVPVVVLMLAVETVFYPKSFLFYAAVLLVITVFQNRAQFRTPAVICLVAAEAASVVTGIVFTAFTTDGYFEQYAESFAARYTNYYSFYYVFFAAAELLLIALFGLICRSFVRSGVKSGYLPLVCVFVLPVIYMLVSRRFELDLPRAVLAQCVGLTVFGKQSSMSRRKPEEAQNRFLKRWFIPLTVIGQLSVYLMAVYTK